MYICLYNYVSIFWEEYIWEAVSRIKSVFIVFRIAFKTIFYDPVSSSSFFVVSNFYCSLTIKCNPLASFYFMYINDSTVTTSYMHTLRFNVIWFTHSLSVCLEFTSTYDPTKYFLLLICWHFIWRKVIYHLLNEQELIDWMLNCWLVWSIYDYRIFSEKRKWLLSTHTKAKSVASTSNAQD